MLIEHTSRSTEDKPKYIIVLVRYGDQQDASTNKVSYGQPTSNVTQPSRTAKTVNSKVNPKVNVVSQWSTQAVAAARSTLKSKSQHFSSGIVP